MSRAYINEKWEDYRKRVIPKDAPDVQLVESRRAFYAGAAAFLEIQMTKFEHNDPDATDADLALMDSLHRELKLFGESIRKGLA
jgi:hypothetical protein